MSPRNMEKDMQMRELRKEQILDSALQAIARKGVSSVSITDIAMEARLSVGNVYNYFKSKEEILSEVLRRGQENYGRTVSEYAQRKGISPAQKLHEFAESWLLQESNWAFTIMLQSVRTNEMIDTEIREAATKRFTRNLEPLASIFQEGQREGLFIDEPPIELAFYFVSLIQGLTLQKAPGFEIPVSIQVHRLVRLFEKK
ncbi:TetR/AcrR family transcriptional regulator [Paenibacillus sp. Marseille-Q4541]|uniref:TetR/AcrR family transcriptional regulator n=1 Tax=Paenibacillus sp. Marseille-Q4541 TaxID=2831522 RepID=UPI001BA65AD2|nr:TetR/AcrR family transcriptional regulator [Paenibacillus sp. Marseille-Q4541]